MIKSIIGVKFGRLTVVEETYSHPWWTVCKCDCGAHYSVRRGALICNNTKSCGCLKKETSKRTIHGHTANGKPSPEFITWAGMISRCTNTKEKCYQHYGGRGIGVCERWKSSFENFLEDMGARPTGRSLDRIDNEGGYTCGKCDECIKKSQPRNCRWATKEEQASNTRANRVMTYKGRTMTMSQWARELGVRPELICERITKLGWDDEHALSEPVRARTNPSGHKGVSWDKRHRKWIAYHGQKEKRKFIGRFDLKEDAVRARDEYIASITAPL